MILGVFIEFFGVKIAVGLSKNRCDLFLTVRFDFGSNLTVGSSYIRYKSFWTVRSNFRFKINRWIKKYSRLILLKTRTKSGPLDKKYKTI